MDQLLIDLCKEGNARAQQALYEQMANRMFRVCYRYVKNEADAEDVLITGFTKLFQNIVCFEYRGKGSLEAWAKRIMVNEALMLLRRRHNFAKTSDQQAQQVESTDSVIDDMEAEEIYALILELPTGYRTVFNLYVIEGYSHKEIAERLQISENTSKSQLSKGRAMLRELLIKQGIHYEL